jgi:type III pantothenate kinase
MTLVVDIGNTNVVCGIYQDKELVWSSRFRTDRKSTADEYYAILIALQDKNWHTKQIDCVAIASVVPDMARKWQHLISKYFSIAAIVINGYSPLGLTYAVSDPGFIGADLVANAFSAWKKYRSNCIIIDFGTATTLQIVTSEGKFMGAIIAPGMLTAASEMFEKTAQLSEIEFIKPLVLLGTNTTDAMLSGIIGGHALMVQGFIAELRHKYAFLQNCLTIATGGISELLAPLIPTIDKVDRTLTLDGLFLAAEMLSH